MEVLKTLNTLMISFDDFRFARACACECVCMCTCVINARAHDSYVCARALPAVEMLAHRTRSSRNDVRSLV